MSNRRWDEALVHCRGSNLDCVLVTVLGTSGSTPRDPGAKMVVTAQTTFDTIGGGRLELLVTERARTLLQTAREAEHQVIEHFPLGQAAQQCCGGAVAVLLELVPPALTTLTVFGAGHVASALMAILSELPFNVLWVDGRAEVLESAAAASASNIQPRVAADPVALVTELPATAPALVLTHDHDLDYRLTAALLEREHCGFVGLIGSDIKSKRFRMRLDAQGILPARLAQLHSPVGINRLPGKEPMAVAVSIAAQLLELVHTADAGEDRTGAGRVDAGEVSADRDPAPQAGRQAGLSWRAVRPLLTGADQSCSEQGGTEQGSKS